MFNIYLQSKKNKQGERSAYLRLRRKQADLCIPLKFSINSKDFDSRKGRVKSSHTLHRELNTHINEVLTRAQEASTLYGAGLINIEEFHSRVYLKEKSIKSLLKTYEEEKSISTYKTYCSCLKAFETAINKECTFESIEHNNILKAISVWKRKGLKASSINTYIKHLSILKNDAYKRGLTSRPYIKQRAYIQRAQFEVKSITKEKFIEACKNAETEQEKKALALYLLSFITRGLYYKDFETLKPREDAFIHYRHKTGNKMYINGLEGLVKELYEYVKDSITDRQGRIITKLLGVSFKTARKTYDSYAVLLGVDFQIRLHLLAQRDRSIKKHYTNFEWEALQEEVNKQHLRVIHAFDVYTAFCTLMGLHSDS